MLRERERGSRWQREWVSHCRSSGHGSIGAERIVLVRGNGAGGARAAVGFRECTADVEETGVMRESRGEGHAPMFRY